MRRLYPTQLRVVSRASELDHEEESKKLYFDPLSKNSLQIGVNIDTNCIYISSPGNWYKSYAFKVELSTHTVEVKDTAVKPTVDLKSTNAALTKDVAELIDAVEEEEREERRGNNGNDDLCGDEFDLWRIVSQIIKTEMGRKVVHSPDRRYLVVTNINYDMAKGFYYLLKHVLNRLGIKYTRSSSLFSPPFTTATMPNVREKIRRRRNRKRNISEQLQGHYWRHT